MAKRKYKDGAEVGRLVVDCRKDFEGARRRAEEFEAEVSRYAVLIADIYDAAGLDSGDADMLGQLRAMREK